MSVAYAYENSWDIGARARGGHMMAGSQSLSCGSDSPTFRSKQQQDTMIRGLSASISLYMHHQPDSCKLSPHATGAGQSDTRVTTHPMRLPSSPPPNDSASFLDSQDVSRTGPENAQAQLSSQGSGSTSSLEAFDTASLDTVDQAFLGHGHGSFVNSLPSGPFKDSDTEGEEQPLDLTHFPDHSRPASPASSVTSSIGEPRDDSCCSSEDEAAAGDMQAESKYRGPLDQLSELESSLPIKRGLSRFFNGKSRSFTSLAEVNMLADVKELAKVENPFNKKRKMFGSGGHHRCFPPLPSGAGVAKRTAATSRTTLALAVSMIEEEADHSPSAAARRGRLNILVPPRSPGPFRSFSLTDLAGTSGQSPSLRRA